MSIGFTLPNPPALEGISLRAYQGEQDLVRLTVMKRTMETFRSREMTTVDLGVDAESLTGALRLYERMGFEVDAIWYCIRKPVRADP